jgi:hypothetical protein
MQTYKLEMHVNTLVEAGFDTVDGLLEDLTGARAAATPQLLTHHSPHTSSRPPLPRTGEELSKMNIPVAHQKRLLRHIKEEAHHESHMSGPRPAPAAFHSGAVATAPSKIVTKMRSSSRAEKMKASAQSRQKAASVGNHTEIELPALSSVTVPPALAELPGEACFDDLNLSEGEGDPEPDEWDKLVGQCDSFLVHKPFLALTVRALCC